MIVNRAIRNRAYDAPTTQAPKLSPAGGVMNKPVLLVSLLFLLAANGLAVESPSGTIRFKTADVHSGGHPFLFYTAKQIDRARRRAKREWLSLFCG